MTKEQFLSYVHRAININQCKCIIEDCIAKYNASPTLTMYPDLGEEPLFFSIMEDAIRDQFGEEAAEVWSCAWYDSGGSCGDLHYPDEGKIIEDWEKIWQIFENSINYGTLS